MLGNTINQLIKYFEKAECEVRKTVKSVCVDIVISCRTVRC